jgi:N-(2-amino-2-carboxyethyl)-L-glutamate synthase
MSYLNNLAQLNSTGGRPSLVAAAADSGPAKKEGILSAIGHTPLVKLTRIFGKGTIHFFAKMEQFNPGGSTKDRPAHNIIVHALKTGLINPDTTIIESSSGNMGIGLAQVCAYHKLRLICVVDPKTTTQNINLLKAYNAEVEMVEQPDRKTGEYLPARVQRVKELLKVHEDSFWPNQYASELNSGAHHQTMHEIATALGGNLDYLFCATSTCGTLRGCAEYRSYQKLSFKIIAVDAVGSVIFGGKKAKRLIPGHGAGMVPPLFTQDLANECVHVNDLDCVIGCHRLVQEEAILAGGSSGAIVSAVERFRPKMRPDSTCVAILPDRGERYLDTIYSDEWITRHFGDVAHLWKTPNHNYMLAGTPHF